jgi:hypothetical protein
MFHNVFYLTCQHISTETESFLKQPDSYILMKIIGHILQIIKWFRVGKQNICSHGQIIPFLPLFLYYLLLYLCHFLLNWRMESSEILRHVALVRTDVSEEYRASFFRVTRVGELGTSLGVTSKRRTLRKPLQELHGVTSQKTPFFIVTAVKTSNITYFSSLILVFTASIISRTFHPHLHLSLYSISGRTCSYTSYVFPSRSNMILSLNAKGSCAYCSYRKTTEVRLRIGVIKLWTFEHCLNWKDLRYEDKYIGSEYEM